MRSPVLLRANAKREAQKHSRSDGGAGSARGTSRSR